MGQMFTPIQVADSLGFSKRTVWGWIRTGRLRAVKIGNKYRIPEEELVAIYATENQTKKKE